MWLMIGFSWKAVGWPSDSEASQFPCPQQDLGEHGAVQTASVGVAERRMVGSEEPQTVGQGVFGAMSEAVLGLSRNDTCVQEVCKVAVEGDLTQADDDADAWQGLNLTSQVRGAVAYLLRGGFVSRRCAADDRGDPGVAELEAVVAADGGGLAGQADVVENGIHKIAGAVSSEDAAGAVGPMGSRREAEDEDARARVAEARHGAAPVGLVSIGATLGFGYALAVVAETGAQLAGDDRFADLFQIAGGYLYVGACHSVP